MNIIKHLKDHEIVFNNISIDLDELKNIICIKEKSKQNNIFYKWYGEYKNKKIILSGKSSFKIYIDIYCKNCNKITKKQHTLNSILWSNRNNKIHTRINKYCKKCACKINGIDGIYKVKETNLRKYGVEWTGQREWHKKQAQQTKIKKYGKNYGKKFADKAKQTYLRKHGVDHNGKVTSIRNAMVRKWKETVNAKTPEEWHEWNSKRLNSYKKNKINGGLFGRYNKDKNSKIALKFFEELKNSISDNIIQEEPILSYFIDFLIKDTCCIEFNGDYWHANPNIYNEYDEIYFSKTKKYLVKKIWEKDNKRLYNIYREIKTPIIVVWEQCYKRNSTQCINSVINMIKEIKEHGQQDRYVISIY